MFSLVFYCLLKSDYCMTCLLALYHLIYKLNYYNSNSLNYVMCCTCVSNEATPYKLSFLCFVVELDKNTEGTYEWFYKCFKPYHCDINVAIYYRENIMTNSNCMCICNFHCVLFLYLDDHSRIILRRDGNSSDYINANNINVSNTKEVKKKTTSSQQQFDK